MDEAGEKLNMLYNRNSTNQMGYTGKQARKINQQPEAEYGKSLLDWP